MSEERIAITGKARETIAQSVIQVNQIQQSINTVIQILVETAKLDGRWILDVNTMELVKQDEVKK